jgi:glycosyltransferase involved in cell wall biosynthesis
MFLGAVHDEAQLSALFARGSVTAVPDYGGLSIPHSLIHGVPVVVNDEASANGPEYEYVRPGVNGTVFPRGDVASLTDALIHWCTNPLSGEARHAVVTQARDDASPVANAQRILDAVSATLTSRRSR